MCFFFRIRLRRFLISDPMTPAEAIGADHELSHCVARDRAPAAKVLLLSVHDEPTIAAAAFAAGADGLLLEVHHDPDHALSDGAQSLRPEQFQNLMKQLRVIAPAVGRTL